MTLQMILALGILIFMIVLIMTDALPFGAPPILASLLLVVASALFGADWETQWDIEYAFAGFVNSTVWMVAFFMVVLAAAQKTRLVGKLQEVMVQLVEKGGFKSYVLLILVVMLGASLMGNTTGYYMLILSLVATIPYNKKLPTSKLLMPLGFATGNALIPVNVAFQYALAVSVLDSVEYTGTVEMGAFSLMVFIASLGFFVWTVAGYKVLPDHPLAESNDIAEVKETTYDMPAWQEYLTYACFIISVAGMMLTSSLGTIAYVIPGLCAFVLLFAGVINFKEMREGIFSPLILMMAGVIPIANALADSGFTALVGNAVAGIAGTGTPVFVIVLLFAFLTSACATITGSNMGSVYIFAPIAAAACMSLGYSPVAAVAAITVAAWSGGFMPIDGLPALIYGMGNYSMKEFWLYTIPMYIVKIVFLSVGACLAFGVL